MIGGGGPMLSHEGKMANILNSDLRSYVKKLISQEFGSVNKVEKTAAKELNPNEKFQNKQQNSPEILSKSEEKNNE
jgi:hypothetical protein